jgi:FSR family fosmidomycin resistance protein-like MFS transporter
MWSHAATIRRRRWTALGASSLAHILHDGFSASIYLLLPVWQLAFGLSLTQVGLLKAVYATAMAGLQAPAGLLAERLGERGLLAAGTVLSGLAFLAAGATVGFMTLALCLFVAGCGASVQHPLSSSVVARAYQNGRRRAALGFYNFAGDIGKLVFPATVALLLVLMPWRWVTAGYAGIAVLVALILMALLGFTAADNEETRLDDPPAARNLERGWGIRDRRGFQTLSAIHVIDDSSRTVFLTFLPFLLTAKGAQVHTIGFALTLVFAGGAIGKFVCGMLAERVGVIRTVITTEILTCSGILLLLLLPLTPTLVLLPILGVALNGTSSVLYGTVAEFVAPERHARAFGLFYTLGSSAGAVGPALYGLASDMLGLSATFVILTAMIFMTVPLAQVLRRSLPGRMSAPIG